MVFMALNVSFAYINIFSSQVSDIDFTSGVIIIFLKNVQHKRGNSQSCHDLIVSL